MYYLYIVKCADGTFYTGITTEVARRMREHNGAAHGAKYTAARRPVRLVFSRAFANRSRAARAEARLKRLSRAEKKSVINGKIVL